MSPEKQKVRKQVEDYFRKVATEKNAENPTVRFEDILEKDDEGKRLIIIQPESIGDVFLITSLLRSIKEAYPNYNIYFATKPEHFSILDGNPNIYKVIPYISQMDSHLWLIGQGGHKGFFEIAFHPYFGTQRILDYLNNGKTNIAVSLKNNASN